VSTPPDATIEQTAELLCRSLRALGRAGRPVEASRLAAEAWWALHETHPRAAQRVNGLMHHLARMPDEIDPTETTRSTTMSDARLDVRTEPPARRHELIFSTYHALGPGETFVLVNDHDPKPLYYQFDIEHAGQYTWEYLQQGPEEWQVRIGRPAA
jgi:uncharacterized protein (DUF2249 family)